MYYISVTRRERSMFRLEKKFRFEAAHMLPYHDGKCRRLHGHSWVGVVVVEGEELYPLGAKRSMLMDFGDLSALVNPLVERYLDHYYLNDSLDITNPTSEEIARWLFNQLATALQVAWSGDGIRVAEVRIEETCTSAASYRPSCSTPSPPRSEP